MAEPLKYRYNDSFLNLLADGIAPDVSNFNIKAFLKAIKTSQWSEMELKQRMRQIAQTMRTFIPGNYTDTLPVILNTIDRLRKSGIPNDNFEFMFLPDYIEVFGMDHPKESLNCMEYITQFTSCEFAIRPFIVRYPELTMKQMLKWSKHKALRVRRLSSEGCRPRLPWAMALPSFKKDPRLILPILENLKSDPSEYVRRSVANNLNDIAKDNPGIVMEIVKSWIGKSEETDKILKHGCRTMLRNAEPSILKHFGMSNKINCSIGEFNISHTTRKIGEKLELRFTLKNHGRKEEKYRVEYGIHFMKSNGVQNRKLFKITENVYHPGRIINFTRKHSFADLTTRKHYPGEHQISIVVNGNEMDRKSFQLKR